MTKLITRSLRASPTMVARASPCSDSASDCPPRPPKDGLIGCASSGVIRRFTAEIEPAALGWTIEAFVEVYCEGRVPPDRMREMVSTIPEVAEAYTVTGEADGILRVRAADTAHFEKVLGIIRNHPGVSVPAPPWFSPDSEQLASRVVADDVKQSRVDVVCDHFRAGCGSGGS